MPKARASSFLTINSLSALSKVRSASSSSSSCPYGLIKPVALLKYLSTATERWELQGENCNGYYHHSGNKNVEPDPSGFPGGAPSPVRLSGNGVAVNPGGGFRERFTGEYGGGPGTFSGDYSGGRSYQGFGGNWNGPVERNGRYGHLWDDSGCQYGGNGSVQDLNRGEHWANGSSAQNPQVFVDSKGQENLVEHAAMDSGRSPLELLDDLCMKGEVKEAVEVLRGLEEQHVVIDMPRVLKLIETCGEAKKLEEARAVHDHLSRLSYPLQIMDYNKILEMYGKCGGMAEAFAVFNGMQQRNLTTWDAMITWLARNGLGEDAIDLFSQFKQAGLKPDAQMFNGVFSACETLGDMQEGLLHFESMTKEYGITPCLENYQCVVEMLASTGYLEEALEFIKKMPMEPSVDIWETLMKLCRVHGNLQLGDHCAELVNQLDPSRLDEQSKAGFVTAKALGLLEDKGEKKSTDQNLLGIKSRVHEYRAGDTSHPDSDKIYALLRCLKNQMKETGYVPETRFVLHDIDQESKEEAIHAHSERLATANALLNSPARSPVRIMKNLRVCGDCHNALKIISKIVGRLFIMRDAKRFHHLKDGVCSCNDYW